MTERRKILEALRRCAFGAWDLPCYLEDQKYENCRLKLMQDAYKLLAADEWISCKDHLPTEQGRYQVYFGDSPWKELELEDHNLVGDAYFSVEHNGWWSIFNADFVRGITHWKKLPEGPEEGRQ